MSQIRYRIYPLHPLVNPALQSHSNLRQEQVLAPMLVKDAGENLLPPLDVKEDADAFYVTLETPGVVRENISLSLQENVLTIKGQKEPLPLNDGAIISRNERDFGSFSRDVLLPRDIDGNAVKAHLNNGILLVTLPKLESTKPRQIPITTVKQIDAETYNTRHSERVTTTEESF